MKRLLAVTIVLAMAGCVSVPNPFAHVGAKSAAQAPEALRQIALQVEQAIQKGDRDPKIENRDSIVLSENVRQVIRMRAARSDIINKFLDAGFGREDRNGLIEILRSKDYRKATTSRQRDREALMVLNENNDRWDLYEGIADATKKPNKVSVQTVQAAFHDARVQCLKPGQKYQETKAAPEKEK